MMHLDAIKKRNRRPERQPTLAETRADTLQRQKARMMLAELRATWHNQPVYVREA